jgi:hypothetical protein
MHLSQQRNFRVRGLAQFYNPAVVLANLQRKSLDACEYWFQRTADSGTLNWPSTAV